MQSVFPKTLYEEITNSLNKKYSLQESESLSFLILKHLYNLTKTKILLNNAIEIKDSNEQQKIVNRLLDNEPLQHIIGYTEFYGRKFDVNKNVLIPRQETEELIELIKNENQNKNLRVLDIGTGSGCIACSLELELQEPEMFALDISEKALTTAKENSNNLNCNIKFIQSNILDEDIPILNIDIIVSNPPYVTFAEKEHMHENVLLHEPNLALFVANDDPLKFYNAIVQKSQNIFKKGGKLYFEINELFGNEVALLMEANNFTNVVIHKDINGKDRFVSGVFSLF